MSRRHDVSRHALEIILSRVRHRGPDDQGIWLNKEQTAGLVHSRLSIIDLSTSGHQPMTGPDGRLHIVFNGEIYNFQEVRRELEGFGVTFRTETDTEVILHSYTRWGMDFIQKLNGMFAIALLDETRGRLILVRDRIGKKPLYYLEKPDFFAFASESNALEAIHGSEIDLRSLNFFLCYGYLPGERSIFKGVRKLLPGHILTFDLAGGKSMARPFWDYPGTAFGNRKPPDVAELVESLENLLNDCVRSRLVADVPVGVLLSGGIDSSLVAAAAARVCGSRIKTFTATFPGSGRFDESKHARLVANALGTDHHELAVEANDWQILEEICRHLDEPTGDPSILPTYALSKLVRRHVTVALGGDGGDELFGGYAWYATGLHMKRYLEGTPRFLRRMVGGIANHLPAGFPGRTLFRASAKDLKTFRITATLAFDATLRQRLFRTELWNSLGEHQCEPEFFGNAAWAPGRDGLAEMSLWDLRVYLPEDILAKVDRASMAVALEMRAPWLDYRMVEFALGQVPSSLKVCDGKSRILQKLLGKRLLPRELNLERKQGFVMPTADWLQGGWEGPAQDVLNGPALREYFNPKFIASMTARLKKGYTNSVRLFSLVVLGLWLEARRTRSRERNAPMHAIARC